MMEILKRLVEATENERKTVEKLVQAIQDNDRIVLKELEKKADDAAAELKNAIEEAKEILSNEERPLQ